MAKLSRESLKRLGELNRSRLKASLESAPGSAESVRAASRGPASSRSSLHGFVEPPDGLPGLEVSAMSGTFLLIKRDLSEIWRAAERFASHYCLVFERGAIGVDLETLHPDVRQICEIDHKRLLYLDIETCGLSAAPVFLIGVQYLERGRIILEQFLARDYSEEKPVLEHFWGMMTDFRAVTTFNGRAFDIPFLRERAVYHRVPYLMPDFHFDLLHEARRRYKGEFPNCKLQTLEARLCQRMRRGDIPGELIPKAYHDFVRTKDPRIIQSIIHHNALDIVTMSEVLLKFLTGL